MLHNSAVTTDYARQLSASNLRVEQLERQLADALASLEAMEEFVRVQGQSQASRLENLDQVNVEVTRLRGAIEVLQHELDALRADREGRLVQDERRQLHAERRLAQLESFLGVEAAPPPTDVELGLAAPAGPPDAGAEPGDGVIFDPDPPPEDSPDAPAPGSAREAIELAQTHTAAGRHGVARAVLEGARRTYGDSDAVAEIDFRVAETHLAERSFSRAALAFKRVIDDHPASAWASWSMLRQGECFDGLGKRDEARLFYDAVIQRYPGSDASREAQKRLGR